MLPTLSLGKRKILLLTEGDDSPDGLHSSQQEWRPRTPPGLENVCMRCLFRKSALSYVTSVFPETPDMGVHTCAVMFSKNVLAPRRPRGLHVQRRPQKHGDGRQHLAMVHVGFS